MLQLLHVAALSLLLVLSSLAFVHGSFLGCDDKPKYKPEEINTALVKFYRECNGDNWPEAYRRNWDQASDKKEGEKAVLCALDGNERAHPGPNGARCVIGPPWHTAPPAADGGLLYLEHLSGAAKGPIPREFRAFQMVDWIGLSGNELTGPLWDTGFHCFLHRLDLSHNKLGEPGKPIDPATFFTNSRKHLELLNLADNKFSGAIPSTINNLETLGAIVLNDNQFSGEIPDMSALHEVRHLSLHNNHLSGKIGRWLKEMAALSVLSLDGNSALSGPLPELPDSIMRFSASFTGFSGDIPLSYGELPFLRHFNCTGCTKIKCPRPDLLAHLYFTTHCRG